MNALEELAVANLRIVNVAAVYLVLGGQIRHRPDGHSFEVVLTNRKLTGAPRRIDLHFDTQEECAEALEIIETRRQILVDPDSIPFA